MIDKGLQNNPALAPLIIKGEDEAFLARMQYYQAQKPNLIRKVVLKLDDLRDDGSAKKISFPFQAVYVSDATDSSVEIDFRPYDSDANSALPLRLKDSLNFDIPINGCSITNTAQSGKEITLFFILRGKFDSGSQLTEVKSSVDGNSIDTPADVTVTTVAALLIAADNARTVLTYICSAPILIAGAVGATYWFPIPANTPIVLRNTAALYAKTSAGSSVVKFFEEK